MPPGLLGSGLPRLYLPMGAVVIGVMKDEEEVVVAKDRSSELVGQYGRCQYPWGAQAVLWEDVADDVSALAI